MTKIKIDTFYKRLNEFRERNKRKRAAKGLYDKFDLAPPSLKQAKVFTWWHKKSPMKDKIGIICDGAIRSGKTVAVAFSFVLWAMNTFAHQNLGLAGKTVGSFRRNVVKDLKKMCKREGYKVRDKRVENLLEISKGEVTNFFYIFGGRDESSQDLIQGITLAGLFLDEVVLMPRSFVDQATGRCSVDGSKFWFTCNPNSPHHWFKEDFINKRDELGYLYLHFTMDDNPTLTEEIKDRYKKMYVGVFYKRFILGLWVTAEGLIYNMFDEDLHKIDDPPGVHECDKIFLTCDYGDNANVILLVGRKGGVYYILDEFYYSGAKEGISMTDTQLADQVELMLEKHKITIRPTFILDTNAVSFKTELTNRRKVFVKSPKKNDVIDGIRQVQTHIYKGLIKVASWCKETLKEFSVYGWNKKKAAVGIDEPIKEHDHAMDCIRYLIATLTAPIEAITGVARA